jgi:hypothetical protein
MSGGSSAAASVRPPSYIFWDTWPCGSGTYIQTVADYFNVIYFKNPTGLFVNLYVPSDLVSYRSFPLTACGNRDSDHRHMAEALPTLVARNNKIRRYAASFMSPYS